MLCSSSPLGSWGRSLQPVNQLYHCFMYSRYVAVLSVLLALVGFVVAASVPVSTQAQDITVTVPEVDPSVDETVTLSIQADLGGNQVDSYSRKETDGHGRDTSGILFAPDVS